MKHTEVAWKVQTTDGPDLTIWNDKECIATVWMNSDTPANAALISKAPELLKVLEELLAVAEDDQKTGVEEGIYEDKPREDIIRLKKLLAEAKGE